MLLVLIVTYNRLDSLKKCVDSLLANIDSLDMVYIHDNCSREDGMVEYLEELNGKNKIKVTLGCYNIGKAAAMNKMMNECVDYSNELDCVCFADPDLVFSEGCLDKLMSAAIETNSIVVPEHTGYRCHLYKTAKKLGMLNCVVGGVGVAGAAMTMKVSLFNEIGGFVENSIYGGNEAGLYRKYFTLDGRSEYIYVLQAATVEHLAEADIGYAEWKRSCQNDIRKKGFCHKRGYYDKIRRSIMDTEQVKQKLLEKFPGMLFITTPSYEAGLKAINVALEKMSDGDSIAMLNTIPSNEAEQGDTKTTDQYCGKSWQVVAELRTRRDISVVTFEVGLGITVVTKGGRNRDRLDFKRSPGNLLWTDFVENRIGILNLVVPDVYFSFADKKKPIRSRRRDKQEETDNVTQ